MTPEVKFIRTDVTKAETITTELQAWYKDGWQVVSHTESNDEYSFVLVRHPGCEACGHDWPSHAPNCPYRG